MTKAHTLDAYGRCRRCGNHGAATCSLSREITKIAFNPRTIAESFVIALGCYLFVTLLYFLTH